MSEELNPCKPCPFCGEKPTMIMSEGPFYHLVQCSNYECVAGKPGGEWTTPEVWNTRPIEDALRARLEAAREDHKGVERVIGWEEAAGVDVVETLPQAVGRVVGGLKARLKAAIKLIAAMDERKEVEGRPHNFATRREYRFALMRTAEKVRVARD